MICTPRVTPSAFKHPLLTIKYDADSQLLMMLWRPAARSAALSCNCAVHANFLPKAAACLILRCIQPGEMDVSVSAVIATGATARSACNHAVEKIQKATP